MKKVVTLVFFSAFLSVCLAQNNDPILMNIAGKDVTKSEFEYIWNKNNTNTTPDKKSLDDYVELFVNFKLKVAEAEAQGIDTTQAFISELGGYRRQLIAPYLTDKEAEEAMIKLCYDRLREYTEVSHILIAVGKDVSPEDTLKAYNKAMSLYKRALKGEDFAKLAKENSDDGSKDQGGYLGFATGLRYVFPFENAAYNTPIGKISTPFRSRFGYHLLKVHNRLAAGGKYRSAHIMKAVTETASPEEKAAAKDSIFKIYNALKNGEDFTKFATQQSDDRGAAERGGEYGLMFCGSLPYEYESNVYKLKVGEFSEPFQSKYGWHLVKALEFQPYPKLDEMRTDITGFIAQDDQRSQYAKKSLVERLKSENKFVLSKPAFDQFAKAYENIRLKNDSSMLKMLIQSNEPLFTINDKSFSQKDFAAALVVKKGLVNNLNEAFDAYLQDKILAYEDNQLEKKYPEFGHLMQEYRDGILLFEVSNREVWDKASSDTEGLKKFFAENKAKYNWDQPRYKGSVILCANPIVAKKAQKLAKKLSADSISIVLKRTFNNDTTSLVKVERGLFAPGENANVDFLAFKKTKPEADKKYPVAFLNGYILEKGPESYTDVRGLVISDYQNDLEEKWIKSLRSKFKVVVYKEVLNTVNKN
jgi:peptidyl-prolyl cis-trans isomerase SurA